MSFEHPISRLQAIERIQRKGLTDVAVAGETAKVDPMHQFTIEPLLGANMDVAGFNIAFTNSALWMLITAVVLWVFMLGGMKRELVPGRWQMTVGGR